MQAHTVHIDTEIEITKSKKPMRFLQVNDKRLLPYIAIILIIGIICGLTGYLWGYKAQNKPVLPGSKQQTTALVPSQVHSVTSMPSPVLSAISNPVLSKPPLPVNGKIPYYSKTLDATFYLPSTWTVSEGNLNGSLIPCDAYAKPFFKNPSDCKGNTSSFYIQFQPPSANPPDSTLELTGPDVDASFQSKHVLCNQDGNNYTWSQVPLTINGITYALPVGKNKTDGSYSNLDCWSGIKASGKQSLWSQFDANYLYAVNEKALQQMITILQTAVFH